MIDLCLGYGWCGRQFSVPWLIICFLAESTLPLSGAPAARLAGEDIPAKGSWAKRSRRRDPGEEIPTKDPGEETPVYRHSGEVIFRYSLAG